MYSHRRSPWWQWIAAVAFLTIALAPATTLAKTTMWTQASMYTDAWSDPFNWDNGVPASFDVVIFPGIGGTSTQDIPGLVLDTMDMDGYVGILSLFQPLDVAGDLTLSGLVDMGGQTISVGGSLAVGADLLLGGGDVTVGMNVTVGGAIVADGGSVSVTGNLDVPAGTLDMGSGSLDIGGDLTVDPAASTFWTPGGTLRFTGSGTQTWSDSSPVSDYGDVEVNSTPGSQVEVPSFLPPLTINGSLSVNSGTLEVGPDLHVAGPAAIAPGAAFAVSPTASDPTLHFESTIDVGGFFTAGVVGGTLQLEASVAGAVTVGAGATFEVIGSPGNLVRLEQDGVAGGAQWLFNHDPTAAIIFDYVEVQDSDASNGPTVIPSNSVDAGNNTNWYFGPKTTSWTGAGPSDNWSDALNWSAGVPVTDDDVLFHPVGGVSIMDIPGLGLGSMDMTGFIGTLTLDHPLAVAGDFTTAGTLEMPSGQLDVGGALSVGGVVNADGGLVTVAGTFDVSGDFNNSGGGVTMTGAGTTIAGTVNTDFATLTITGHADVLGDLHASGGVVSVGGGLTCSGGTLDVSGSDLELTGGDLDVSGATSSNWTNSTLTFDGGGTQTWTSGPGSSNYGSVVVSGTAQVVVSPVSPPLTLDGDLDVGGAGGTIEVPVDIIVGGGVTVAHGAVAEAPAWAANPVFTFDGFFDLDGEFSMSSSGGTLRFASGASGTVSVGPTAAFTVIGSPGNLIRLEQDGIEGGSQWLFNVDPAATTNIEYVRVQDSDASAGNTVTATRSENAGNNDNWNFGGAHTIFGNLGPTDNWSDAGNWSNGVPLTGDTVSFDPIGGLSVMDIPGLTLATMDMTGFTGTLDQTLPLSIDGFVVTSGSFELSGNSLTVGGSLHVGAGSVNADGGGVLEVHGPITGDPGVTLNMGDGLLAVYDDVDLTNFNPVLWGLDGAIEGRAHEDYQIDLGATIEVRDVFVKHFGPSVKLTIGNAADSIVVKRLHVETGTVLTSADITCDIDADIKIDGSVRGTYNNGYIDIAGGVTLAEPSWEYKWESVRLNLKTGYIGGQVELRGDSVGAWFGAGDTIRVNTGGSFNVISDSDVPAPLRLNGAVHSDHWYLDIRPGASTQFENVDVQDSDATPGQTAVATGTSVDGGNNLNWDFQITAADDAPPARLAVHAFPNPFNPGTTIRYTVPQSGPVSIRIYDVAGRLVRTLVADDRWAGEWTVGWDGRDGSRDRVGSGVYFCRVESGGETVVHKLVLLR